MKSSQENGSTDFTDLYNCRVRKCLDEVCKKEKCPLDDIFLSIGSCRDMYSNVLGMKREVAKFVEF